MVSRVIFALALIFAIVNATSIPVCVTDSSTTTPFTISCLSNYITQCCAQAAFNNFSSNSKNYNMDSTLTSMVSLNFTSAATSCLGNNSVANCENYYGHLLSAYGTHNSTTTGSGSISTGCGIYTFKLSTTKTNNANATNASSKSGSGKASGISYCMVTGSLLLGVAAFFGWFL